MNLDLKVKEGNIFYTEDITFIIGNGINNYNDTNKERSWDKLLILLYNHFSSNRINEIPKKGINLPEFFDLLVLHSKENDIKKRMRDLFIENISKWTMASHYETIINKIKIHNCPILTTNFDDLICQSVDAMRFYTLKNRKSGFTDFYPWECYFANNELSENNKFSIWFINGMKHYPRSIKLGLNDYLNNFEHAKKMLPRYQQSEFVFLGKNTWLKYFFFNSLFILGLKLEEQETFLRWLLIQRAMFYRLYPEHKKVGWFVTVSDLSEGREFFLRSVGFEIIKFSTYESFYKDFWLDF
jgi:hypothetical protein